MRRITVTTLALCAILHFALASGSDLTRVKDAVASDSPPVGTRSKDAIAWSRLIPLNRPYDRFTAEEKLALKSLFEPMPEADEPPFPESGLRPVIQEISLLIASLRLQGHVRVHVEVNSQGEATRFTFYKAPSQEVAKAVASVFSRTKFKPAKCGGSPCQMEFPFETVLQFE